MGSTVKDAIADADIRQGIKQYADWPTIPQLYVNGEFVGGSDILKEMHQSGELQKLLEGVKQQAWTFRRQGSPSSSQSRMKGTTVTLPVE